MPQDNSQITDHRSQITRLKVLTVVGTRPEIIRLSQVILKLDASPAIEHILVHTGQNYDYELNEVFFEDLGLRKPDYFLNAAGGNATTTAGQILINIDPVLESQKPDAFLVLGDTNSCLCAIAAKKRPRPGMARPTRGCWTSPHAEPPFVRGAAPAGSKELGRRAAAAPRPGPPKDPPGPAR